MIETRNDELRRECQEYHDKHPEVWELFVDYAMQKWELGYQRFSSMAVIQRIRWETTAGADAPHLKINDHHATFYGRRFNKMFPHIAEGKFFRTRKQPSKDAPATGRPEFIDPERLSP